ncbi:hypothetical protein [Phenylobacterium sp.]|jgi:hypothetical protein|uniref:hypothetical protein n=1 Tax=Phenylobacterium sp. TaxID=1871053 RepID=UPI002E380B11|nr:hypothetical protein [Phenylobacterium sp.]HEX3364289.1 hypothetical protein [Phenylobacterium sp.]
MAKLSIDISVNVSPRTALRAVLAAGLLVMLGANLPGHLSYDSVAQLYEGHFHIRETWGPALYAWVLGFFDRFIPGTSLYVTVSAALLFGSLAAMADLRPRTSWWGVLMAALVALTPQLMIYQGIVWKDIMFADCAVAGFVLVAWAGRVWPDKVRRWTLLIAALVLMAAGAQVRQNGIIAGGFAALAVGWIAAQGSWRRGIGWAVGALIALVLVGGAETTFSEPPKAPTDTALSTGLRIVQSYDLLGAIAMDPNYKIDKLSEADPAAAAIVRARAKADYSGRRVDFVDRDTAIQAGMNALPDKAFAQQWIDLIIHHPGLYLRVRWEDFRWVFAPPVIDWCLPVYVGIDAPIEKMAPLGLQHRFVQSDVMLSNYASWFLDTPVMNHAFYFAVSLVLAGLFLWRRQEGDVTMAAMQLAAVAFSASFFIISIACDYRYLYFSDLAALAGLLYAAVDPPLPWLKGPMRKPS